MPEEKVAKEMTFDDVVDKDTFLQLLEMDDDEEHEFSKSIVWNYFEQAETTFQQMDKALTESNLAELSSLGHFLKGSSAALGLKKIKGACEKIQYLGARKDETESKEDLPEKECLERIEETIHVVKEDYAEAEIKLKEYYE